MEPVTIPARLTSGNQAGVDVWESRDTMKQTIKFTAGTSTLDVVARSGKSGISVFVRTKVEGGKMSLGCPNKFASEHTALATEKFEALVAEAKAAGWTQKAVASTRSTFTAIPMAPTGPIAVPAPGKKAKSA